MTISYSDFFIKWLLAPRLTAAGLLLVSFALLRTWQAMSLSGAKGYRRRSHGAIGISRSTRRGRRCYEVNTHEESLPTYPKTAIFIEGLSYLWHNQYQGQFMSKNRDDDIFFFCTIIEFIARATKNHRQDVIAKFSTDDITHELNLASVNHCLSFEQVSDEWIEKYNIQEGTFDTVTTCKYDVPSVTAIGRLYQRLILSTMKDKQAEKAITDVFSSFISDAVSNFNSNVYYSSPDYLKCSYNENMLLA